MMKSKIMKSAIAPHRLQIGAVLLKDDSNAEVMSLCYLAGTLHLWNGHGNGRIQRRCRKCIHLIQQRRNLISFIS